jgi:hypothetical protein
LAAPGKASYYTLYHNDNGSVVRWNPCRVIGYKVKPPAGAKASGAIREVKTAVSRLEHASGLTFHYDGKTQETPTLDSAPRADDVVIAWARPGQTDALYGDAVGTGGWFETGKYGASGSVTWQVTGGYVVVDSTKSLKYGFGHGIRQGTLLLHELGHVAALRHTSDRAQVMYPVITSHAPGVWGAGDLAGLRKVGRPAGCIGADRSVSAGASELSAPGHFANSIHDLKAHGVVKGYAGGDFKGGKPASRQAFVTFAARLLDKVVGKDSNLSVHLGTCSRPGSSGFADVPSTSGFCAQIVGLTRLGVINGYDDGGFRPTRPVSRQAIAAYLFRLGTLIKDAEVGSAGCRTPVAFNDVGVSNRFCGVIEWMDDHDIAHGYDDGGFHPAATTSRQAAAAFLDRFVADEGGWPKA